MFMDDVVTNATENPFERDTRLENRWTLRLRQGRHLTNGERRAEQSAPLIDTACSHLMFRVWHWSLVPLLVPAYAHRIELSSKESLRKDRSANPHGGHPER